MRFVGIEISTKHKAIKPRAGEKERPDEWILSVDVPQAESLQEAVNWAGGEQAVLDVFNSQVATSAGNLARAHMRNAADDADPAEIEQAAKGKARDFVPETASTRGPSQKEKVQRFDKLAELVKSGQDLDRDAILALLEAAK